MDSAYISDSPSNDMIRVRSLAPVFPGAATHRKAATSDLQGDSQASYLGSAFSLSSSLTPGGCHSHFTDTHRNLGCSGKLVGVSVQAQEFHPWPKSG